MNERKNMLLNPFFWYSNMEKIRNGISETIGHFVMMFFDIVISILISFIYGWRLTLAICAYIPLTMVINYLISKVNINE